MISVGIDYSINSPSMCICDGEFLFENCRFYVYSNCPKKYVGTFDNIHIVEQKHDYSNIVERFCGIADFYKDVLTGIDNIDTVGLEDYAFAAAGRVFQIGENTFALKEMLWKNFGINPILVAPTAAKRFATGKGNAKKEQMFESFSEFVKKDIAKTIGWDKKKIESPLSDIVDSFYICGVTKNGEKNSANR